MKSDFAFVVIKEFSPGQRRELRQRAVRGVRKALLQAGFKVSSVFRPSYRGSKEACLVISAGGDGTLLAAAKRLRPGQVLLGVNTDPVRSVGFLCGARLESFSECLRGWRRGTLKPRKVRRLAVEVRSGGRVMRDKALNDVLITSRHPAGTSRYWIRVRKPSGFRREAQRSSGIWVASAAGSTAAIHGAGGVPMPMESGKFQFRVREPYVSPGGGAYRLAGGVLGQGDTLTVVSRMDGVIYVDGSRVEVPFPRGAVLRVRPDPEPILLLR